ncbi:MAG: hypothetical protein WCI41_01665 [bacterium]
MKKNKHPTEIPGYEGNLFKLVDFIVGELRFDEVKKLHQLLSERYLLESKKEEDLGHIKASGELLEASKTEGLTEKAIERLWIICKPYTK